MDPLALWHEIVVKMVFVRALEFLYDEISKLGFGNTTLVIDGDEVNTNFALASSNIPKVNVLPAVGANVYDILKHETLVLTRAAVEKLEARFNG